MRRRRATWLATLALALAPCAAAATVYEVFTVTSLQFLGLGGAEATSTATGLATVRTSSSGSSHLSTITLPTLSLVGAMPVSEVTPITSVRIDLRRRPDLQGGVMGNVSGAVGSTGGGLAPGTVAATGGALFCLLVVPLPPCVAQVDLSLGRTTTGGGYVGSGVGGVFTIGSGSSVRISIVGAPYTVKTVSAVARTGNGGLELQTARGFAHGPASLTSSTAASSGVLQVVTATRIPIIGPGDRDINGTLSRITLVLIPEPALLAAFASGAALVGWLGLRRRRH